jgi:antigen flippase
MPRRLTTFPALTSSMKLSEKPTTINSPRVGSNMVLQSGGSRRIIRTMVRGEFGNVLATFLTTLSIFGVFLVQGIIVARILGPLGRGEFGTALYFPRDVLLYAGLLGGIEIVNSYAVKGVVDSKSLKYSAARLGLLSGSITAVFAATLSTVVLTAVGKQYLLPFCLLCCLFVPFEHMQLTISAVDRGTRNFRFYNINRLIYAIAFPILVIAAFSLNLDGLLGMSSLTLMCLTFVLARIIGLLPTLRGMEIVQTLIQWRRPDQPGAAATLPEPSPDSPISVAVPGAWKLMKQGRFYALSMLASELFERLDIFLIVALATVTESGHYFVAVPAAALLTVAPNALAVFTFNAGADLKRKISLRQAIVVLTTTAVVQIVAAFLFSLIVPFLIILFYEEAFAAAIPFALWLLPASAIKGFLQAADGYLKGRDKPMIGVRARLLSIAVMLAFVWMVYHGWLPSPQQKLLSIPMAACLGQALSMVIITSAVLLDVNERQRQTASLFGEAT